MCLRSSLLDNYKDRSPGLHLWTLQRLGSTSHSYSSPKHSESSTSNCLPPIIASLSPPLYTHALIWPTHHYRKKYIQLYLQHEYNNNDDVYWVLITMMMKCKKNHKIDTHIYYCIIIINNDIHIFKCIYFTVYVVLCCFYYHHHYSSFFAMSVAALLVVGAQFWYIIVPYYITITIFNEYG